ncbi:hypothetical protein QUF64_04020 [Anaerolineales bacterium HSG6]|nr:hypothetical protein [Anaerolineales bacterium HSG6]MDM8531263.1 hypothetical protein [Anaerolineales bacterium HSG25]
MFEVVYDYPKSWLNEQSLHIAGQFAEEIPIAPAIARRKANGFFAGYITMMVIAGQPKLVLGKTPVWRVSANLSLPNLGVVATLGTVDVSAKTGKLYPLSEEQIQRMQELAHVIATHFTSTST